MSNENKIVHPHDMYFKSIFGRTDVMLDFLEHNLPAEVFSKVDKSTLRLTNKSFVNPVGTRGESDLVFQATMDNQDGYIYMIVEHQAKTDKYMPLRFMEYNLKLFRQHLHENKDSDDLPLVLNICVYNGKEAYTGKRSLLSMFKVPELAKAYTFGDFQLVDLTYTSDNELVKQRRAALGELILKYGKSKNFSMLLKFNESLKYLLSRIDLYDTQYYENTFLYILAIDEDEDILEKLKSINPETKELVMTAATRLIQQGRQEGEQFGLKKGRQEEKYKIAKEMLAEGFDIVKISRITGLTERKIKNLSTDKV
ncbi:Rpn family recombination-promoting nuclease/putative transposase [Cardinium endosymbiont of Culicoides punctatus]|uniref:Rpn family recombination-promoting nuclease/putative transposase n=1 Tax=Cardinium endosymbiont of Culicoides punctatus TaxID=2304601 RepID=UPI0010586F9D|nr:Rpn family recombination-promoting nuclease/putative transposase [Cardinium endosymbiont of Culicoides punctatus]TDG95430.1 hypothetical protein CCPUN_04060 [Cardinium endosymbiont of Culicoides punctatus]